MSTLATTNLKHASSGSNNVVLASDGSTTISNRVGKSSYAIIADQKASGTNGGTFTSGAWRTRDLNTEIADPDGIVSISSNQFTLGTGSYLIRWTCPVAGGVQQHQSKLYNITTAADVAVGINGLCGASNGNVSPGSARVTLSGSTVFEIQHRCDTTVSNSGFGQNATFGTCQYTTVEIFKEA